MGNIQKRAKEAWRENHRVVVQWLKERDFDWLMSSADRHRDSWKLTFLPLATGSDIQRAKSEHRKRYPDSEFVPPIYSYSARLVIHSPTIFGDQIPVKVDQLLRYEPWYEGPTPHGPDARMMKLTLNTLIKIEEGEASS